MGILIEEKNDLKVLFAADTLYRLEAGAEAPAEITTLKIEEVTKTNKQEIDKSLLKFSGSTKSGFCFLFLNDVSAYSQVTDKLAEICKAFGIVYADTALCDLNSNAGINILDLLQANNLTTIIAWGIDVAPFNQFEVNTVNTTGSVKVLKTGLFREIMADIAKKKQFAAAFKQLVNKTN